MVLKTLRNLTLHEQGEREIKLAARRGYLLTREAEGVAVEPGQEGLRRATQTLANKLRRCREQGESVLVGGHMGLWLATSLELAAQGQLLPAGSAFPNRLTSKYPVK
jgi:hypothetical protein